MKKIQIARSSSLPNKLGSFAYRVLTPITAEMGLSGFYTTTDGTVLLYSRVRVGDLNKPFTCECRVNTVEDKKYINLIDSGAELAGQFGDAYSKAERAGFGDKSVTMSVYLQMLTGNQAAVAAPSQPVVPAVQAEPAVVVEEPVIEAPAEVVKEEAPATAEVAEA